MGCSKCGAVDVELYTCNPPRCTNELRCDIRVAMTGDYSERMNELVKEWHVELMKGK